MDNHYMIAENIVELILNKALTCKSQEEVIDEIRGIFGQIKCHKFE